MLLATRLYERGDLSLGQAAELAGYSKRTFMELLADYGYRYSTTRPRILPETPPMPELIIADASCLILLQKLGELNLLRRLPEWLRQKAATDVAGQERLAAEVDAGEASAITLALEKPGCTLILQRFRSQCTGG